MVYSFQENMDDYEPSGKYDYLFYHFGTEETKTVEGDTSQDAFRNLHHEVGGEWSEWQCLGRKDIIEYKMEVSDFNDPINARCSTTGLHPTDFRAANEQTVERWEEEDEE
jgi:hypothetical protein